MKILYITNLIRRQSASLLSCELKSDAKKLFQLRGDMDLVVLIDEDTTQEPENMSKPIWILHNILTTVRII